ncbi:MAG: type II toxin-antitoxin system HipA family toxin [Bacteroidales bacterium]|nr:type II toxin-antitoxin system HipA family toxin [Bacteroidales bacterium]
MITNTTVDVRLWDISIGKLRWDNEKDLAVFQFSKEYIASKYNLCPVRHRRNSDGSVRAIPFYGNPGEKYQGLPEFIADSLPDSWGNTLFDKWMSENNISSVRSNSLLKLSFMGRRAMGALEFYPEVYDENDTEQTPLNIVSLRDLAIKVYMDRERAVIQDKEKETMKRLILLGTSAGGKHPKGVVAINKMTGEIRSGQVSPSKDFRYFIIKFKEDLKVPTSEIEMVYHEMAVDAGINMTYCELKEIDGTRHFMTERFDRVDGKKLFTQTMAAIIPDGNDYMHLFFLCETLNLPYEDKENLFRRMVFNHVAGVTDDHNKNFSFIMDESGTWRLSPAYDVMFTANIWENGSASVHALGLAGKRSHVTFKDLVEFGEDYGIKKPEKIVKEVYASVSQFRERCHKYNVDEFWINRIEMTLKEIHPDYINGK